MANATSYSVYVLRHVFGMRMRGKGKELDRGLHFLTLQHPIMEAFIPSTQHLYVIRDNSKPKRVVLGSRMGSIVSLFLPPTRHFSCFFWEE
jgi:hypothetical protein